MKRLLIAALSFAVVAGSSLAEDAKPMPGMDMKSMDMGMMAATPTDTPSTQAYKAAMIKMMQSMPMTKFTGDPDIDFMTQMRVHHTGAIEMAKVALGQGKDAEVKKLAQGIIETQEKEIATIDSWLKGKGK